MTHQVFVYFAGPHGPSRRLVLDSGMAVFDAVELERSGCPVLAVDLAPSIPSVHPIAI